MPKKVPKVRTKPRIVCNKVAPWQTLTGFLESKLVPKAVIFEREMKGNLKVFWLPSSLEISPSRDSER